MSREWREARTLQACMDLATEAAAQLDLLALLPPETSTPHHHTPLSTNRPPVFSNHHLSHPALPRNPDAMEIDALGVQSSAQLAIMDAISHGEYQLSQPASLIGTTEVLCGKGRGLPIVCSSFGNSDGRSSDLVLPRSLFGPDVYSL
ncbi:hypothetical protein PCASD_01559 [Puccinia coronata f. sp. avenae]|uniref:Uncharacterized protein n=1 Tax=Puccinia coronata f. sp. avenae TaxID=200324 RepID=A0A2N5VIR3_9BASI|nr:hypothetical protein PCASD_01559 [Puccinia coronata f. sp. avenae]